MKKLFAVILITLIAIPTFSQLKFGIKAGINTNSINMSESDVIKGLTSSYKIAGLTNSDYGFHGGVFLRLTILKTFFVQPEVLFATSNYSFRINNLSSSIIDTVSQKISSLSIPVLVGIKLGPIRINAGPVGNVIIGSPGALIKNDQSIKELYNKMSIGYQAGLGLDLFKKITIDVKYEGSLQKYKEEIQQAGVNTTNIKLDSRPSAFLFSLGLMF
jgi:hypothetical protein